MKWLFCKIINAAYQLGYDAKENDDNPYKKETNEWFSWNRGYNQKGLNEI